MADQTENFGDELRKKFPKLSIRHVLVLQAFIRGTIVRLHMKHLRKEFVEIFDELQQNEDLYVCWKKNNSLCLPSFTKFKEEETSTEAKKTLASSSVQIPTPNNLREVTPGTLISSASEKPCNNVVGENGVSINNSNFPVSLEDKPVREDANDFDFKMVSSNDRKEEGNENVINQNPHRDRIIITNNTIGNKNLEELSSPTQGDLEPTKDFDKSKDESQCLNQEPESKLCKETRIMQPFENTESVLPKNKDAHHSKEKEKRRSNKKNIDSLYYSSFKSSEKKDRGGYQTMDSTLTDVSSVWDSVSLCSAGDPPPCDAPCPETVASLQLQRENVALELIWLQQAILSRKSYLRLKSQMGS